MHVRHVQNVAVADMLSLHRVASGLPFWVVSGHMAMLMGVCAAFPHHGRTF
jgi:hypothetical protein